MRKYIIGMLFGFLLSFTVGAHAEVKSFINSVVQGSFPVTIEGKKLESPALVIEGSTYLPVRSFGEAIGYKVGFDDELGVNMTKSQVQAKEVKPEVTTQQIPVVSTESKQETIGTINRKIESIKLNIKGNEMGIASMIKGDPRDQRIEQLSQMNEGFKSEIADLEKQKAELQK